MAAHLPLPRPAPACEDGRHLSTERPAGRWLLTESRLLVGVVFALAACLALLVTQLGEGKALRGPSTAGVVNMGGPRVSDDAGALPGSALGPVGIETPSLAKPAGASGVQGGTAGGAEEETPGHVRRPAAAPESQTAPGGASSRGEAQTAARAPSGAGSVHEAVSKWVGTMASALPAVVGDSTSPQPQSGAAHDGALRPEQGPAQEVEGLLLPLDRPWRIAHRGASAELPEHTREAYELAVAEGADFIECDVVLTADLVPICRHEPNLATSTDAPAKFPDRWRNYTIDGANMTGIFSVDLTAAEVATLRAVQPWPFRDQSYNGRFPVATLADFLDVALSANRSVGVYPETKHPSWTNALPALSTAGVRLEDILLSALETSGFTAPLRSPAWRRRPVFLQSFEASSLRYMAARTCVPSVLLLGEWEGWVAPDSGMTLQQITSDESLAEIAEWAAAVGPDKTTLVDWREEGAEVEVEAKAEAEAGDGDGERTGAEGSAAARGVQEAGRGGGSGGLYVSSGLVERFHSHGLQVHTYTLRPESRFFLPHLADLDPGGGGGGLAVNVSAEYSLLLGGPGAPVRVDGVFADHMPSLADWLAHHEDLQHQHKQQEGVGFGSGSGSGAAGESAGWQRQLEGRRSQRRLGQAAGAEMQKRREGGQEEVYWATEEGTARQRLRGSRGLLAGWTGMGGGTVGPGTHGSAGPGEVAAAAGEGEGWTGGGA